jgi:glycosyltransferase involved in cell wall biosynthesis
MLMTGRTPVTEALTVKILLLESGTGPGGSVNFLRDFLPFLDAKKVEPLVGFYYPNSSTALNEIRSQGVPVTVFRRSPPPPLERKPSAFERRLKPVRVVGTIARIAHRMLAVQLPLALRVARFVRKNGIGLIVFNQDIHFHLAGVLAAKLARVPCVCRKAGGIGEAKRIKRVVTPWVDLFVSVSEATDCDQRNTPGTKKLLKIHEGVDLRRFQSLPPKEAIRRDLGVPEGKKVVAAISRIEKGKGQVEFLHMAAEVLKRDPNTIFLVVGDQGPEGGSLMEELNRIAHSLQIDKAVVFSGWRNDIPSVLNVVDIFVHCPTSFIEGLCIANLEAMAMAKPAVVSHNGGLPDAVLDGVTGFVTKPGDVEAMTSAVVRLLGDEELRRKTGLNARLRVEQLFDMSQNAQLLQDALLECAGTAARSRLQAAGSAKPSAA